MRACETYGSVSEESGDRVKKGQPSVGLSTLALSQLCVADRVSDLAVLSSFVLRPSLPARENDERSALNVWGQTEPLINNSLTNKNTKQT